MTARAKELLRRSSIQSEAVPFPVQEAAGGREGGSAAAKAEADELRARLVDSEAEWKAHASERHRSGGSRAEASTALPMLRRRARRRKRPGGGGGGARGGKAALESSVGMEAAAEAAAQAMA